MYNRIVILIAVNSYCYKSKCIPRNGAVNQEASSIAAMVSHAFPKISDSEKFSDKCEDPQEWLDFYVAISSMCGWNDEKRIEYCFVYVQENHRRWVKDISKTPNM